MAKPRLKPKASTTLAPFMNEARMQMMQKEAKRHADSEWLAQNYVKPAPPPPPPRMSKAEAAEERYRALMASMNADDHVPDPAGVHREVKSIYSPAPRALTVFERPKKRMGRDPYAVGTDCTLPDDKRKRERTYNIVDDSNRVTGAVRMNDFRKQFSLTSPRICHGQG